MSFNITSFLKLAVIDLKVNRQVTGIGEHGLATTPKGYTPLYIYLCYLFTETN